jgi:hypothetical protein
MFTPTPSVSVPQMILSSPLPASRSTTRRYLGSMPAWCTPTPWCTKRRSSAPKGVSQRKPVSSCLMAALSSFERKSMLIRSLRVLGGSALREVHHVDGCLLGLELGQQGLVQRLLGVLPVERHRAIHGLHERHGRSRQLGDGLLEARGVAQRGAHEQEARLRQREQRHLPGDAAVALRVEVELVDHHHVEVGLVTLPQRQVREDLRRAADDRCVPVDAGVAGHHAHVLGPERLAQLEELLADQRLDGGRVERAATVGHGLPVRGQRDQRLARPGGRVEDDALAVEELEDGLLLRGVERQPTLRAVGQEPVEQALDGDLSLGGHHGVEGGPGRCRGELGVRHAAAP